MSQNLSLQQVNQLSDTEFVRLLGAIFEHSPWVAERVCGQRPFASVHELHAAMVAQIERAGDAAQLKLLRAHPELAGKAAVRKELTQESTREQSGAGLDQCSPAEFARLQELNAAYMEKFGFPFIVAVRGHTRHSIIDLMAQRVTHAPEAELRECLGQVFKIGQLRLQDLIRT